METLVGKTEKELEGALSEWGVPAFRGRQLTQALYRRHIRDLDALTDLPRALRDRLRESYVLAPCRVRSSSAAPDGTVKYLMDLPDDEVIESVFLPYPGRTSVCISS